MKEQQSIQNPGLIQVQSESAFLPDPERARPGMMLEENNNDQPMTVQQFMNQSEPDEDRDKLGESYDGLLQ